MAEMKMNPVTLDIVKDSLIAISNEVFYAFARTSMSPIIYETLDYASGIADVEGRLLTQGNGACGFIGLIAPMIQEIINKYGRDQMQPGDVYLINDPYLGGGTHLSDIGMVMPVFYFIGNSDFFRKQKKHAFSKLELGKRVHGNGNKTMVRLEDIKTFFSEQIVKRIVFI